MKQAILFMVSAFFAVSIVTAQPGRGNFSPEDMAERQTERLAEKIDLNKKQESKVYELNLKYAKKLSEMFEKNRGSGGGFEAMREKMEKLSTEKDKEMKLILTEDQWPAYLEYKKVQEERRAQRRPRGGPGGSN